MTGLEQMLRDAGAHADWPATPDIAAAVAKQVREPHPAAGSREPHVAPRPVRGIGPRRRTLAPPSGRGIRLRRPLAVALAALLLMTGVAAAVPGIREPVLDFLGLRSVHIERVPRLPAPAPGARLSLGDRTTLASARAKLGFTPVVFAALGAPVVWYDPFPEGGQLGLVYRRGRLLVTEVHGRLEQDFLFKFAGPGTRIEPVRIDSQRGVWLAGAPHQFGYADASGELRTDSIRLAGDVLLWRRGPLLLRLEGARSKTEALTIARSARAAP